MNLSKYIFTFSCGVMFCVGMSYADSILFLPDSNKSQKRTIQNDFSDGEVDSDLRLFDIQQKGFNSKDEKGFRTPIDRSPITQDSINPPKDMQQEDLPREYKSMFETSLLQTNTESKEIKLAENTPTKKAKQNNSSAVEIANGATFIAVSSEKNPQEIRINNKVFPWVLHPKDSNKKIAFVAINYRSALENLRLNNDFSIKIVQGAYKREKITITDTLSLSFRESKIK